LLKFSHVSILTSKIGHFNHLHLSQQKNHAWIRLSVRMKTTKNVISGGARNLLNLEIVGFENYSLRPK
ncbi:hypothetical protein, partial [Candidatus Brocadia sapporoensis]|uniref:hypothetical protein n=1 Tax=Candidatus Brocadia sapporoensis TaxID=392547 RepID=UPI001E54566C